MRLQLACCCVWTDGFPGSTSLSCLAGWLSSRYVAIVAMDRITLHESVRMCMRHGGCPPVFSTLRGWCHVYDSPSCGCGDCIGKSDTRSSCGNGILLAGNVHARDSAPEAFECGAYPGVLLYQLSRASTTSGTVQRRGVWSGCSNCTLRWGLPRHAGRWLIWDVGPDVQCLGLVGFSD